MNIQSRRLARRIACSALALSLMTASPMLVGVAAAQTAIVDPNAPKEGMTPHAAALAASAKGDYISALDFAKKAAAAGQPLEADQVDFISGKAAKQQAALDDAARIKATQQAAAVTAQQIQDRQQKDYAQRSKREVAACTDQGGGHIGVFTSASAAAATNGSATNAPKYTGADKPANCPG